MQLRATFVPLAVLTSIVVLDAAWSAEAGPLRDPVRLDQLRRSLGELMRTEGVPGLGLAIIDSGGVIAVEGLGLANTSENRAVEADTVFSLGSLSHAVIALAALKLVEEDRVYLQIQLSELIPEMEFLNPWEYRHPLRLDHILEHSGGLEEIQPHGWRSDGFVVDDAEAVRRLTSGSRACRWEPGAFSSPSEVGPLVVAYAVSKIVDGGFEEWVAGRLFEPLSMGTASLSPDSGNRERRAVGYLPGGEPVPARMARELPPLSLYASVRDMANLVQMLVNRGSSQGLPVVSRKSLERMETPSTTPASRQAIQVGYGLGIRARVSEGFLFHGLESAVPGGWATFAYLEGEGRGYVVVANGGTNESFRRTAGLVKRFVIQGLEPPRPLLLDLPERRLAVLTGYYRLETHPWEKLRFLSRLRQVLYIRSDGGRLAISRPRGSQLQFFPVTDRRFRGEGEPLPTLVFSAGPQGRPILHAASEWLSGGYVWTSGLVIWMERVLGALCLGLVLSCLVSGPARLALDLRRGPVRSGGVVLLLGPFLATATLCVGGWLTLTSAEGWVWRLGQPTVWSGAIYVSSMLYPLFAVLSPVVLAWRGRRAERGYFFYVSMVCLAGLVVAGYLAYWGVLGLRTWE